MGGIKRGLRKRRFTVNILENIQGGIRLTGLRYVYQVNKLLYDIFGDSQTEAKLELENIITNMKNHTENLKDEIAQYNDATSVMVKKGIINVETIERIFEQDVRNSLKTLSLHYNVSNGVILKKISPSIRKFLIHEVLTSNHSESTLI